MSITYKGQSIPVDTALLWLHDYTAFGRLPHTDSVEYYAGDLAEMATLTRLAIAEGERKAG